MVVYLAVLALSPQHHQHHARMHSTRKMKMKMVDEEPAIRADARKVERCFETKNYALFRSMLTSNFQQEMPNHQVMGLKQALAGMRQALDPMTEIKAHVNVQAIHVNGHMATVDDRYLMTGKMRDKKGKHNVRVEGSETVSLKKVGGKWLAYYDKVHDQSVAMDGHVVMHMP